MDYFAGKKGFTGLRYPNYSQLIEQSTFPEDVWAYVAAKQPSRKEGYDTTTRVSFVHKLDKEKFEEYTYKDQTLGGNLRIGVMKESAKECTDIIHSIYTFAHWYNGFYNVLYKVAHRAQRI